MTKFCLLWVLTLSIWVGKVCSENCETINELEKLIRDEIYAVGDQFVDDFVTIEGQYQNNFFIQEFLGDTFKMISKRFVIEKNSKIGVNQVRDYFSKHDGSSAEKKRAFDYLQIMRIIFSKKFSPERYNGVVNLIFACVMNGGTSEEVQSALNYLYGNDIEATKTSFLDAHNLPKVINENDCPGDAWLSKITDAPLRRLVDIKPNVIQHFLAIREQFPCNEFASEAFDDFIFTIYQLGGDKWKINACMVKENPGHWNKRRNTKDYIQRELETLESILSTRLPDETIRGILNFKRATIPDTSIDEIEKALVREQQKSKPSQRVEYLYDDVPKLECPTTESSTLKAA